MDCLNFQALVYIFQYKCSKPVHLLTYVWVQSYMYVLMDCLNFQALVYLFQYKCSRIYALTYACNVQLIALL